MAFSSRPARSKEETISHRAQAGEAGGPATVIDYRGSYEDYLASAHAVLAAA
jgi:hypothetical protein